MPQENCPLLIELVTILSDELAEERVGLKKLVYTLIASAAVAAFSAENETEANTHKVGSGESLWKIANKYNLTLDELKKMNQLQSDVIYANQVLKVGKTASVNAVNTAPAQSIYQVKPGDTLSAIAAKHKTTVSHLMTLNQLTGHHIFAGQTLKVSGSSVQIRTVRTSTSAASSNYTVKPGDTLSKIAIEHGISLSKLMDLNQLKGHIIHAGQQLSLKAAASVPSAEAKLVKNVDASGEYTVKPGDTLSKIALLHNMSLADLKSFNQLSGTNIYAGQKLYLSAPKQPSQPEKVSTPVHTSDGAKSVKVLIETAVSLAGTPYVWGGATPEGFDCSGFIYYVYQQAGFDIARVNAEGLHARSYEVAVPQIGDIVFFENTYKPGISHAGIYIGNNQFIHAGDNGVMISSLENSYWKSKFESVKRFY
ncbi:LysM peptidoglycan-binding domain-containing protein [Jeotgalibacillus sp. JSM ZJ347]|uniref:C40 family peptidase n=1 Tax=Jeotgalibacillus sp. JSM ZJ347 TaxID=3342117 RepID=UPI0035A8CF5C